jgi:hypothetical protein
MERDNDEILALYNWQTGDCFRCAKVGVDTTLIAIIRPPSDGTQEVRACRACVLDLEAMRQRAAVRTGRPYTPGRLADVGE